MTKGKAMKKSLMITLFVALVLVASVAFGLVAPSTTVAAAKNKTGANATSGNRAESVTLDEARVGDYIADFGGERWRIVGESNDKNSWLIRTDYTMGKLAWDKANNGYVDDGKKINAIVNVRNGASVETQRDRADNGTSLWQQSYMRNWLNDASAGFMAKFSDEEKSFIDTQSQKQVVWWGDAIDAHAGTTQSGPLGDAAYDAFFQLGTHSPVGSPTAQGAGVTGDLLGTELYRNYSANTSWTNPGLNKIDTAYGYTMNDQIFLLDQQQLGQLALPTQENVTNSVLRNKQGGVYGMLTGKNGESLGEANQWTRTPIVSAGGSQLQSRNGDDVSVVYGSGTTGLNSRMATVNEELDYAPAMYVKKGMSFVDRLSAGSNPKERESYHLFTNEDIGSASEGTNEQAPINLVFGQKFEGVDIGTSDKADVPPTITSKTTGFSSKIDWPQIDYNFTSTPVKGDPGLYYGVDPDSGEGTSGQWIALKLNTKIRAGQFIDGIDFGNGAVQLTEDGRGLTGYPMQVGKNFDIIVDRYAQSDTAMTGEPVSTVRISINVEAAELDAITPDDFPAVVAGGTKEQYLINQEYDYNGIHVGGKNYFKPSYDSAIIGSTYGRTLVQDNAGLTLAGYNTIKWTWDDASAYVGDSAAGTSGTVGTEIGDEYYVEGTDGSRVGHKINGHAATATMPVNLGNSLRFKSEKKVDDIKVDVKQATTAVTSVPTGVYVDINATGSTEFADVMDDLLALTPAETKGADAGKKGTWKVVANPESGDALSDSDTVNKGKGVLDPNDSTKTIAYQVVVEYTPATTNFEANALNNPTTAIWTISTEFIKADLPDSSYEFTATYSEGSNYFVEQIKAEGSSPLQVLPGNDADWTAAGLKLATDGQISGSPDAGTYNLTVKATNTDSGTDYVTDEVPVIITIEKATYEDDNAPTPNTTDITVEYGSDDVVLEAYLGNGWKLASGESIGDVVLDDEGNAAVQQKRVVYSGNANYNPYECNVNVTVTQKESPAPAKIVIEAKYEQTVRDAIAGKPGLEGVVFNDAVLNRILVGSINEEVIVGAMYNEDPNSSNYSDREIMITFVIKTGPGDKTDPSGLPTGALIGIIAGAVVVVAAVVVVILLKGKSGKAKGKGKSKF